MLIFDGLDFTTRVIKLRPRQTETCVMCSRVVSRRLELNEARCVLNELDYAQFCGVSNFNDKSVDVSILDDETERVTCQKYKEIMNTKQESLLLDVRPECQFKICAIPDSTSKILIVCHNNLS